MIKKLLKQAEDLLHIQEESSIERLKGMLRDKDSSLALPILLKINEVIRASNAELLLSLALQHFHIGDDDKAFAFLDDARAIAPCDHQVLRTQIFLLMAIGDFFEARLTCEKLLSAFPSDAWARSMQEKALEENNSSLRMPALQSQWEDLIRK